MNFNKEESFFNTQPMFVCDQANLLILDVNEAAVDLFGFSKKEFLKKRITDLGKKKDSGSDAENGTDLLKDVWIIEDKEGNPGYFQFSAHLINYRGKPSKIVVAHHITSIVEGKKREREAVSTRLSIENFPMAEIEWDASLNILRWSPKAEELFGWTEQEAIAEPRLLEKFIHPEDRDYVKEQLKETLKEGRQNVSMINRNLTKDGKVIYCEWYNSMLYDAKGNVVSVYSLTHDVSDREEAMDNAKRSMESYRDLFDSISDAIFLMNFDGIILEANKGLENTFGFSRREIIGEHYNTLSAPGKFNENRFQEIIENARSGEPANYEGWRKKKNGEVFPTELLVNKGNYFGDEILIVIERDMSERKASEEALKHREGLFSELFNSSPIGIALLNEHKEVDMLNEGFEKIFGYKEEELKGLELDKVIVPKSREEGAARLSESTKVMEVTEKRTRKDGKMLDVIIYAVPVIVEGKTVAIYGIYVDITDRKKAEEQVRKSLKEKEVLLAEIHHRVKNNLAVITGLLELQSNSTEDQTAKKILKVSQMRVNSIALVHEKLYQSDDLSEVSIDRYFEELTDVVHRSMNVNQVEIDIELDVDSIQLPITQAIPSGLLVNEVITNAFKHAFVGKDSGKISVSLKNIDEEMLRLTIRDNGVGLPELNNRVDISSSLGMTLIKTLAKQLDAEVKIRNENGAVFEFEYRKEKLGL